MGLPKTYEEALKRDEERFWSKVDKTKRPDGCWVWTAGKNNTGRGTHSPVRFKGVPVREGRASVQAHVWAYILKHGNRPLGHGLQRGSAGLVLRHICGNGDLPCVNPAHLRVGTQHDNNRETAAMGRRTDQQLDRALAELAQRNEEMDAIRRERDRMAAELARLKEAIK